MGTNILSLALRVFTISFANNLADESCSALANFLHSTPAFFSALTKSFISRSRRRISFANCFFHSLASSAGVFFSLGVPKKLWKLNRLISSIKLCSLFVFSFIGVSLVSSFTQEVQTGGKRND